MRRAVVCAAVFSAVLAAAVLAAAADKGSQPKFKTLEVKHVVIADGVVLPDTINPQAYAGLFYDDLRAELAKKGIAAQIVEDGASVSEADAAESAVVEVRVTGFKKAGHTMAHPAELSLQADVTRRQDHAPIASATRTTKLVPGHYRDDANLAKASANIAAGEIKKALK